LQRYYLQKERNRLKINIRQTGDLDSRIAFANSSERSYFLSATT
jgi:hypothetical protein